MITFGETNTKNENKQYIRKIEQIISESAKKVLNETKWIDSNDEPIDGPDYGSIDNPSQNNLSPIDRYHPDYWYYRQEEEPYDPTYDEGYLDDYTVNNDDEFKDDLDDWGIKENKQYNKNRNMKQTIRLRESELRHMISESVKGVINELDWKTYMNAAKKAYDSAENDDEEDRAWKFADASEKAFNRDYRYVEPDDNLEYYGQKANQDVSGANFTPIGQYGVGMGSWTPLKSQMHSVRNIGRGETNNSMINPNSKMKPSKNTIDAYQRAEDEMEKYANGKYNYKKGKGWQLKESINRKIDRIVSESIKRMLNESDEGMKQFIKMHKQSKAGLPMSKLFHISKTFNGDPNRSYVIWFGERIVDTAENYEEAVAKCKEIYNSI